jgi:DNA-binding response OmpR family regulator
MKILLVEDDQQLRENLQIMLQKAGFAVDTTDRVSAATENISAFGHEYDCLVLDINLPDGDGFSLCEKIRRSALTLPILMMTARDAVSDKVKGLNLGADDYVTKPVDSQELLARIRSLIRRSHKQPLPELVIGDLTINPQTRRVIRGAVQISLTAKEFSVLELLAFHADEVVTRTMLMERVWGSDFETFSNVIDVYIKNLRKKIDSPGKKKLLHTIRGSGYSLSDQR